jgi:hypothetical protein
MRREQMETVMRCAVMFLVLASLSGTSTITRTVVAMLLAFLLFTEPGRQVGMLAIVTTLLVAQRAGAEIAYLALWCAGGSACRTI